MKKVFLRGIILLLFIGTFTAGFGQEQNSDSSLAQWISPAGKDAFKKNSWFWFRKTFELTELAEAKARIAVDSKYWLFVNGEMVVFEGGLKRGPDQNSTYIDTVDLSSVVKMGENEIIILLCYWGRSGFSHNDSGQAGLFFQSDFVCSDASWAVHPAKSFGRTFSPYPNFRLSEYNIRYNAMRANNLGSWLPNTSRGWKAAKVFGAPPVAPWGSLVDRPIPLWKDSGIQPYTNWERRRDGSVIADLPYNAQITPWFKIQATPGLKIDIRTDNYNDGGGTSVRTEYITGSGVQSFETPGWMSGHQVIYDFPRSVKILELGYRETGYDASFSGSFTCSDLFFNKLWEKSRRTLYINMRDTYMDCPGRERAQWWGDIVIMLEEASWCFGPEGNLLTRKGLLELAAWQSAEGKLYSPIPGSWDRELPHQMLQASSLGLALYYQYSGDLETVRTVYPAFSRYFRLWKVDKYNKVVERSGDWYWADWGDNIDKELLTTCWYALGLRKLAFLADELGLEEESADWIELYDSIKSSFDENFWQGDVYRSADYNLKTDDRSQAIAILSGLAGHERFPALIKFLEREYHASPGFEKYVLEALYQIGAVEIAEKRMKTRFQEMVDSELTTLWEGWSLNSEEFGGGTYNHAWGGHSLYLLPRYYAGISPAEPGFKSIKLEPFLGSMDHLDVVVPVAGGLINVKLKKEQRGLSIKTSSPVPIFLYLNPNTHGEFEYVAVNIQSGKRVIIDLKSKQPIETPLEPGEWVISYKK
ncbi:MAG: hypothetical protein JXR63_10485 [Spirochaetales bacterium]|nr:hypothetical protein [Spirochaetales bacterium]